MTALRKRVWKDAEVGELARDTDDAISRLLPTRIVTRVDTYAEPFFLAMAKEPAAIVLVRCQLDASPETVVACGSRVSFTFIAGKGARALPGGRRGADGEYIQTAAPALLRDGGRVGI